MGLFDSLVGKGRGLSDLNRYVDDYKLVEEKDAKGRVRKKAVYVGTWTVLRQPAAARLRLFLSLGLALALAAAYVRVLLLTHAASGSLPVMLPLLAGLFPLLYLLMGCLSLPFGLKPMRRDQYMHSFIRASRSAAAVGILALAGVIASIIYRAVHGDWMFLREDILFLTLCLLVAGLSGAVIGLLRGVDLAERENASYKNRPL